MSSVFQGSHYCCGTYSFVDVPFDSPNISDPGIALLTRRRPARRQSHPPRGRLQQSMGRLLPGRKSPNQFKSHRHHRHQRPQRVRRRRHLRSSQDFRSRRRRGYRRQPRSSHLTGRTSPQSLQHPPHIPGTMFNSTFENTVSFLRDHNSMRIKDSDGISFYVYIIN